MAFSGANPEQLEAAAGRIREQSRGITGSARRLRTSVNTSPWHGRSADQFRSDFNSHYYRSLVNAAAFLESAEAELRRNAREQTEVSSVSGSVRGPRFRWPRHIFPGIPIDPGFRFPKLPRFPSWGWPDWKFPWSPGFRFPALPFPLFPGLPNFQLPGFWVPRDVLIGLGILGVAVAPGSKGGSKPAPQTPARRPAAPPAPPAPALAQGPSNFSQQNLAAVAERYNGQSRPVGWNQPGECVKWVQSWVAEAGGPKISGGSPFGEWEVAGGVRVPQPVPGDVFQRSLNNTWEGSPHTAIVKSFDSSTGKITLIEGNVGGPGLVQVNTYDLSKLNRTDHEIRFYRLGKTS